MTVNINKNIEDTNVTPLHFTPGSNFMKNLENKFEDYIQKIKKTLK